MKANTEQATPVVFRVDRRDNRDVYALFPTLPGSNDPNTCTVYQHIGQHSGGNYHGCIASSRPARPDEYKELAKELRTLGYNLVIMARATPGMHNQRRKELERA